MEDRYLGEEIKICVRATEESGLEMSEYNWRIKLWTRNSKQVYISKGECVPQDDGSYVVCLDTNHVGAGILKLGVIAQLPDAYFDDGLRTSIAYTEVVRILKRYEDGEN